MKASNWKYKKRMLLRGAFGERCPQCEKCRPLAHPSILLPQQTCKVDGYTDPRPKVTDEARAEVYKKYIEKHQEEFA